MHFVDIWHLGAMVDTVASQILVSNHAFTEYKGELSHHIALPQSGNAGY